MAGQPGTQECGQLFSDEIVCLTGSWQQPQVQASSPSLVTPASSSHPPTLVTDKVCPLSALGASSFDIGELGLPSSFLQKKETKILNVVTEPAGNKTVI